MKTTNEKLIGTIMTLLIEEDGLSWTKQLTDKQIDLIKKYIPQYDPKKIYKQFDTFVYKDVVCVVETYDLGYMWAYPLLKNSAEKYSSAGDGTLIKLYDEYDSTLPKPFNKLDANLNLEYMNSIYNWIGDGAPESLKFKYINTKKTFKKLDTIHESHKILGVAFSKVIDVYLKPILERIEKLEKKVEDLPTRAVIGDCLYPIGKRIEKLEDKVKNNDK